MGVMKSSCSSTPSRRHRGVEGFLLRHVDAGDWPGATYAFGPAAHHPRYAGAVGCAALEPRKRSAREDGLYDLASLTKALFTAPIVLRLVERGVLDLDTPVDAWLQEWPTSEVAAPSIREMMTHRAGFPAWLPLYREAACPGSVIEAIARSRLDRLTRGENAARRSEYSCLGPIVVGVLLERVTGRGLRTLLHRELRRPLGVDEKALDFGPVAADRLDGVAPTEAGRRAEAKLAGCAFERRPPFLGTVHDGNADFLGGAAGNAGLFGTASAVFRVASAMLLHGDWLTDESRRMLHSASPSADRDDLELRTFGLVSGADPSAPAGAFGPQSCGHVGFTGTSIWLSPEERSVAVLLSNRVHPEDREDAPMQRLRSRYHDLVAECLRSGA